VTSFHLPRAEAAVLNALVKRFPNIVLIDVAQALAQVQGMMDQVARAVQFVFCSRSSQVSRCCTPRSQARRTSACTKPPSCARSGPAGRRSIAPISRSSRSSGAAAGFVAAAGATGLGWFVAARFLQLEYVPDPAVWLIGILGGAGGVALTGYLGTRRVLVVAPLKVLRSVG
jgi:putative ABC transport system permease protein